MAQNNPIGWFEIYVDDMERAVAFYQTVLNTGLERMDDPTDNTTQMMRFPDDTSTYGAGGALVKMDGFGPGPGGTLVYFSVEDCAIEEARVAEAGGQVVQTKQSLGEYGAMSLCKDTEGNIFGLHSTR